MCRHSLQKKDQCVALVVGHYCHDQLTLPGGEVVYGLGKSVLYITNVFEALGMECKVASKLGQTSCIVHRSPTHPHETIDDQQTTKFFADFTEGEERILRAGNICAPIKPLDII